MSTRLRTSCWVPPRAKRWAPLTPASTGVTVVWSSASGVPSAPPGPNARSALGAYTGPVQGQWSNHFTCPPPVPVTAASHSAPIVFPVKIRGHQGPSWTSSNATFRQKPLQSKQYPGPKHSAPKPRWEPARPTSASGFEGSVSGLDPGTAKGSISGLSPSRGELESPRKAFRLLAAQSAVSSELSRVGELGRKARSCGRRGAPAISLPRPRAGTAPRRGGPAPQLGPRAGGPRCHARPPALRLGAAPPACPGSPPWRRRALAG